MAILPIFKSDKYEDGRTKQAFKDQTDINKIIAMAAKGNTISHLAKHGATYGDFSDIGDLLTAHERLKRGQKIFDELPAEVKREFDQDIGKFYSFVNDPSNAENLGDVLPGLAKPGNQMPVVKPNKDNIDKVKTGNVEAPVSPQEPPQTAETPPSQ